MLFRHVEHRVGELADIGWGGLVIGDLLEASLHPHRGRPSRPRAKRLTGGMAHRIAVGRQCFDTARHIIIGAGIDQDECSAKLGEITNGLRIEVSAETLSKAATAPAKSPFWAMTPAARMRASTG